jgi:hypothetical protein
VGVLDPVVLVVQDRGLHGPLQKLVGVAAEELVQGVLAGDVEGEPFAAPPGAAPHLAQAGDGPGEGHADRRVQVTDVDAQLERVGRNYGQQVAIRQARLDLTALLGGVARPVRRDALGELRAPELLEPHAREALDQLDAAPTAKEADRAHPLADQVREQLGRLRQHRLARHRPPIDHWRVPHPDASGGPRRAVGVHQPERLADQALGELDRVGDGRRSQHEARLGPVAARDAAQAAQDVGHVRAEDAPVGVSLVDDDPAEVRQEVTPALVVGKDPDVEHVGVGEDQVRAPADLRPIVTGRVAVVDRVPELAQPELRELAGLVLSQRLRRVEVQGAGAIVAGQRIEHREVERQRLAGGGAARHDHVFLGGGLERLELVRVKGRDPAADQRRPQLRREPGRYLHVLRGPGGLGALRHQAAVGATRLDRSGPPRRGGGGASFD